MVESFSRDFLDRLDQVQKDKVNSFLTNFGQDPERIENLFDAIEYQEKDNGFGPAEILRQIQIKLVEEQKEQQMSTQKKKVGKTNYNGM